MKVRKGNVGTSVEWRLNSENDSRLHGQPSFTNTFPLISSQFFPCLLIFGSEQKLKKNYNYKNEDNREKDQRQDQRNVIL
jgi:hypothetical protein